MPVIKEVKKFDYTQLLSEYLQNTGKVLKPVKRHENSKNSVLKTYVALVVMLLLNISMITMAVVVVFNVKFVNLHLIINLDFLSKVQFKCPHCGRALSRMKERSCFYIWKCTSLDCSFYKDNLNSLSKKEREIFKLKPENFKLHYIFREFTTDFVPLSSSPNYEIPSSSLSRIYSSSHTLGLILTYSINYGLSARKTASILYDVHGLKISHQTVINYRNMVSFVIKPFLDNYPYEISSDIAADETYIRVNGKWNYIFFYIDTIRKTILSYYTSPHRDTESCIIATDYVLSKFKEIPEDLSFTTDGNPIYLLAQYWFSTRGINFDVNQVIGLKNQDELSKKLRPFKQAVERHNRSFKTNYRSSHGFGSRGGSVAYVLYFVLFSIF